MSLWINGDWQSGRGPARSKHRPGDRQTALGSGNGNYRDDQQNRHFGERVS